MKQAFLLLFIIFSLSELNSQITLSSCGVAHQHDSSGDQLDFQQFRRDQLNYAALSNGSINCDTITVQIYVCRNNQGQTDIDPSGFYESLDTLNSLFKEINIHFISQLNYIDDDNFVEYRVGINSDKVYEYRNPKAINVYLHDNVFTSTNLTVSGIGSRLNYYLGGRVHLSKLSGLRTHIHEVGHAFGLLHTHGKYNFNQNECDAILQSELNGFDLEVYCKGAVQYDFDETIDINNDAIPDCQQIGDNVCDTPASPILTNDIVNCLYVGNEVDIFGDNYNPLPSNVMSYGTNINCGEMFTQGQKERMRFIFEKYGDYLSCSCDQNIQISNANSFGDGSFLKAISCAFVCDQLSNIEIEESLSDSVIIVDQIIRIKSETYINTSVSNITNLTLDFRETPLPFAIYLEPEISNVHLNGLTLINISNQGIHIDKESENITISNIEILDFEEIGIIVNENNGLDVNNCILKSVNTQTGVPLRIINSSNVLIENNILLSGNSGIYLQFANDVLIKKNRIGIDELGNPFGQHLSSISIFSCNNIDIGTNQIEDQNIISNSSWNGVSISQNSQNISYRINSNYCHENSSLNISNDSNNNTNRPSITSSGPNKIAKGTGIQGAKVNLYKDDTSCDRCEGYEYLGSATVNNNGLWEIEMEEFLVNETRIIANQISGQNSSPYSWCHTYNCFGNGNVEITYNGIDDDCDLATLDDDLDQDSFMLAEDCDDTNALINPSQVEITYNGVDDDCNDSTLDDDLDQDGFILSEDCDDNNALVNPGQTEIVYNGIDDDCDESTLDDDLDQDGFVLAEDCDDTNDMINPIQDEITYNGIDDDCNDSTLDDDLDQDGFLLADDCDDENSLINPDAVEIPNNGIDEDCDGEDLMTATYELEESTINIYPNPATDIIQIDIDKVLDYQVSLISLNGKIIFTNENIPTIDVSSYPSGLYILELKTNLTGKRISELMFIQN